MSKQEALKVAEEYVLRHRNSLKRGVTQKEIQEAVHKVAKALERLQAAEENMKRTA